MKNVDYNISSSIGDKIKAAANIIYSLEARRKFESLVKETKPDLIHLHIFQHQLSPSILDVIKKYQIPTVYTAHDLKMLCLNYKMMHHGRICEACNGGRYYHCALNKCVKESFAKSCVNVVEGYLHKWKHSYDVIGTIITPSAFYKEKFEKFGVSGDRVMHIPNFIAQSVLTINPLKDKEQYYLYFGRISEEKGIMTLLKAVEKTDLYVKVVGMGPLSKKVEEYVRERKMHNVSLLGFKNGQELSDLVGNAKAIILPSEWYENGPYSAIEALQLGRPIIGADIGGIPELIDENGYLFESKNADALKNVMLKLENLNDEEYQAMVENSYRIYEKYYTPESHFKLLKKAYEKVGAIGL